MGSAQTELCALNGAASNQQTAMDGGPRRTRNQGTMKVSNTAMKVVNKAEMKEGKVSRNEGCG